MNYALFRFLNASVKNPLLDVVMPILSDKDYVVIPGVALAIVLWSFGKRTMRISLAALAIAFVLADSGSSALLKNLFQEPRPYLVLDGVNLHRGDEWIVSDTRMYQERDRLSYGFPSSHAANAAAAATVFALWRRRTMWVMAPLALLIGVSRVYTGDHYPYDVAGGFCWGIFVGAIAWYGSHCAANRFWPLAVPLQAQPIPWERKAFYSLLIVWSVCNFGYLHLNVYDLAGEEAQYWDWSRRLALGYYSKPPLIAYVIDVFTNAGGSKPWAIRSAAVFFTSGTLAIIYALTRRVTQSEKAALIAALVSIAMPAFWVGSTLITVDPLLIFFWALCLYAFFRAVGGERHMWLLAGVALGLGILSKYTMAILLLAFGTYVLFHDRRWLRHWGPYAMLATALLLNVGVLHWNWRHDWVSFRHTAAIGAESSWTTADGAQAFAAFLGSQAGVAGPLLFFFFMFAGVQAIRAARVSPNIAFLAYAFWTLLVFYGGVAWTRTTQPNWAVCAYVSAGPLFAWWWTSRPRSTALRRVVALGLVIGCALGLFSRSTDVLYALGSAAAGNPRQLQIAGFTMDADQDPTNELQGGGELGAALTRLQKAYINKPFIFSDRYQLAALASFYTKGQPRALCANLGDRRFNQYDLWDEWPAVLGQDGLYVTGGDRWRAKYFVQQMISKGAFRAGEPIEEVAVYRGNVLVRTFTISRMVGYTGYDWRPDEAAY